jgi:hypothetical protein
VLGFFKVGLLHCVGELDVEENLVGVAAFFKDKVGAELANGKHCIKPDPDKQVSFVVIDLNYCDSVHGKADVNHGN